MDGTLILVRDRQVGASSRNRRFSANVQVIIDAATKMVIATARPAPGNRADTRVWRESGLAEHGLNLTVLADGAYINTGLVVPHRKRPGCPLPRGRGSGQRRAPQGPRPRRARLRPHQELQDPPRLPAVRRQSPPRCPGHRPYAQPRPHGMTSKAPNRSSTCPPTPLCNTLLA
ncbi:transposase [Streptomyces sp. NBC_01445]|uniref:transposase n=1 Tax=Streptomyces sp. NBC_01445 TaxID=2903869 RepID=UPI002DDB6E44|nr:transposase [Streptomyces sp. NBC_01445]